MIFYIVFGLIIIGLVIIALCEFTSKPVKCPKCGAPMDEHFEEEYGIYYFECSKCDYKELDNGKKHNTCCCA